MSLVLKNPHSVLAAIHTRPEDVFEIRLHSGTAIGAWDTVVQLAQARGIRVRRNVERREGGRRKRQVGDKAGRSGSAEATVAERSDVALPTLFKGNDAGKSQSQLWVALDRLQDPQNVGAVFRSAAFFGVRGIILSRDKSAPISATVYDVASGGMEYVPFSVQTNLSRALDVAKKQDLWVLGASEHAETDVAEVDGGRSWLLVLGNEEKGLRRLTLENCDDLCRLTPRGAVSSLNVSVAAGCLMAALTTRSGSDGT